MHSQTVMKLNPGTTFKFQTVGLDETPGSLPTFKRMYMNLGALKIGCKPIISLDRCFLKGPFGGQLLNAISRDGNDNNFYKLD